MRMRQLWIPRLWIFAVPGLIAFGAMVYIDLGKGTLRQENTPVTLVWYGLAFAGYLAALVWTEKQRAVSMKMIWGAALLFRVVLLFTTPTLSDDVYRYIWDGHVSNHGESPYSYAIEANELDHLSIPARELANNTWMASPYLPAAQGLFSALTKWFLLGPKSFQVAAMLFDLGAAVLIAKLLSIAIMPGRRVMLYLWNPLVILESAHGAHVDAFMVFLALAAVWLTFKIEGSKKNLQTHNKSDERTATADRIFAPIFLALATLTKVIPSLFLPVLFWHWRWWQLGVFILLIVVVLVPFGADAGWGLAGPLEGTGLFGALRIYADQWKFNSGIFHWVEIGLQKTTVSDPNRLSKMITGTIQIVIILTVWWTAKTRMIPRSSLRLMSVPLMGFILMSATAHPWYLFALLAFIPFLAPADSEEGWRWWIVAPWLYLSGAIVLSYLTYIDPEDFHELEWVRNVEWLPFFVLLTAAIWFAGWNELEKRTILKNAGKVTKS